MDEHASHGLRNEVAFWSESAVLAMNEDSFSPLCVVACAALKHEPDVSPPWPEALQADDDINAWMYEANRDRALADVLSDSRDVFHQLVGTLDAISPEDLQDPHRFAWLEGEPLSGKAFFAHFHEEHEPDMRAWLGRVRRGR